jgi:hypothetical protein
MRRKLTLALGAVALVAASLAAWLACSKHLRPPVAVSYVEEFEGHPMFWVSNRTEQPVLVGLSAVEVPVGSTWSNCLTLSPAWQLGFPNPTVRPPRAGDGET